MPTGPTTTWSSLAELHSVRSLARILGRRGVRFGFAHAGGEIVAPHPRLPVCAAAASAALAKVSSPLTDPRQAVIYASHDGLLEAAVPVLVDGRVVGAVLGGGWPAAGPLSPRDVAFVTEVLELAATEVAAFLEEERAPIPGDGEGHSTLVGRSAPMEELRRLLDRLAPSDATVLVEGENGTGKELVAKAIHAASPRRYGPFVVQNCSAFNDNLLDSELFGHRRGAFTGAIGDKPGLFEVADGGTFFLDEIGDMSPALQVKVLRVLQEGTFFPVGDTTPRRVDVRVVAATHRDLATMVAKGRFREDLYYRLHVLTVTVPPLRERREDIPELALHFLRGHARGRARPKALTTACLDRLLAHDWPGNVRELENEVERLVVLAGDAAEIGPDLLSPRITSRSARVGASRPLPEAISTLERQMIDEVLGRHDGNKTRAARDLGISRRNLIRLAKKYALDGG